MNRDSETAYKVEYRFFFDPKRVLNLTYKNGKKTGAKTRFARIDVSNYEKLLSDCLAEAIGVDDCQFFEVTTRKIVATCESPKIIIYVTVIEDDEGQAKYGLRKFWKASE